MADETQLGSALVSLLPVIVGGVIGVIGGLAGPPLTHWLSERAEKRKKRAEKFEEMMGALYDHQHWLMMQKDIYAFGEPNTHTPSPMPKALAIAAIYFPTLKPSLAKLDTAASKFALWTMEAGKRRLEGKVGEINDGLEEAIQPYVETFEAVIRTLRQFAMQNLKQ